MMHWNVWRQMKNFIPEKNKIVNISPAFYQITLAAHYKSFILSINKLFDKAHTRRESLHSYLKYVKRNPGIFDAERYDDCLDICLENDILRLAAIEPKLKVVNNWRHTQVAHLPKTQNISSLADSREKILVRDIDEIFEVAEDIINRYSRYFDRNTNFLLPWNWYDFKYLLDAAEKGEEVNL